MKLSTSLLLPALVGAAAALSDASVYIFQRDELPRSSNPPTLTPEQARLVFAQRLATSQYHGLGDASESTLSYINSFGGRRGSLFEEDVNDTPAELVLIVEGVSSKTAQPLIDELSTIKPAFAISKAPSMTANKKLVSDINQQCGQGKKKCALQDAINPFDVSCWNGNSKIIHFDLIKEKNGIAELMSAKERLIRFANKGEMNVVMVLMPESARSAKSPSNPYGRYEKVSQSPIGRRQTEEPMIDGVFTPPASRNKQVMTSNSSDNSTVEPAEPITGVPPLCHSSHDACVSATNNCSGHGACYKKYGNAKDVGDAPSACFTCGCTPTNNSFTYAGGKKKGFTLEYWGGSACQKKDVSSPFWLITIFSVVMIGVVGWAIGLLFSIGEEKLPGVIGAGVSSKTR